jgi:hypothetical protein
MIITITQCDLCGRKAIPREKRNTRITVRLEFNGRLSESHPLDLCEDCLERLTRFAEKEENNE